MFLKVALLMLHCYNRVKYAYTVLLLLAKVHVILSKKLAFDVLQNQYYNRSGKAGENIPLNLRVEHLIGFETASIQHIRDCCTADP